MPSLHAYLQPGQNLRSKGEVMTPWLTDEEVADATRRRRPSRQAEVLRQIGVPFQRRPDGTLLVGRAAIEVALSGVQAARPDTSSNGLNWSRHA